MKYVIIGAGVAGVEAALEIRRRDAKGSITILDMNNEADGRGYIYRPALKEFLSGAVGKDDLSVYPEGYLHRLNIRFIHDLVSFIHPADKAIEYLNGSGSDSVTTLPFDRLLVATGADPSTPALFTYNPQPKNLFHFKTLLDALTIRWWIGGHHGACCVVGGGILGMEAAELLRNMGQEVIMATRSDNRLFRGIPDRLRYKVMELYHQNGIRSIHTDDIMGITMDGGQITALEMIDETPLPVDTIILCAGVEPSPLLRESGEFEFSSGIHVDDHMRTTVPDIYAAGDCAFMPWAGVSSGQETLRLWEPSRRMGRVAGANMAGGGEIFDPWPMYYHTHLFGIPVGFFGSFHATGVGNQRVVKETGTGYRELVLREGRIVGGSFLGGRPYPVPLLRLMRSARTIPFDPAELLEDTFDQDCLWYI